MTKKEEAEMKQSVDKSLATKQVELAIQDMSSIANIGTEEVSSEDLNTPTLKIIQSNTQDVEDKKEGAFYRSDTHETLSDLLVNLVYVTTAEAENFNKTGLEKVKIYYGFYAGTTEPFKLYVRGWSMNGHRNFQSEVGMWKNKLKVPMLALTVKLSTEKQQGTIKETGNPYTTYKLKFEIAKDSKGNPIIEGDSERISFLVESVNRFKEVALIATESENDTTANAMPFK